jgi:hypothetical protein
MAAFSRYKVTAELFLWQYPNRGILHLCGMDEMQDSLVELLRTERVVLREMTLNQIDHLVTQLKLEKLWFNMVLILWD